MAAGLGLAARFRLAALLLAVAATLLAAPARAADIVLGMSAAFTGPSRGLGIELYRGSRIYFDHVNAQGGVYGRRVLLEPLDDGYNPVPAIHNTIHFISRPDLLMLFNYVGTPTVTRVLPLLKKYASTGVLMVFPLTGAQPHREAPYTDYVFNLRASYRQETAGLVDLFARLGRRRIAVFYQVDAYGRSGWDGVRRALSRQGLEMAAEATYHRGADVGESMARQVEILRKADPDAIICVGSYQASAAFIRDARDAGFAAPIANLSFVGSESLLALLQRLGRDRGRDYTSGLINTQVVPSYEDLTLPAVREYRRLMDESAPPPPPVAEDGYVPLRYSFIGFEGFLNAKTLVAALRHFGQDPTIWDLREVFESVDQLDIGIDTPVHFTIRDHQGLDRVYYTTVHDGKFVPIKDFAGWSK
ncbi:MAG: ABC transporter substrate-binding protein [Desulfovibrionaceae bacterium]|jgi:ABC-type branched-subunit amino acid transport system substrate-binding protein|nr:ABC transporter substrate-binding protein [Desulfovibrionaceae bacterium]